MGSFCKKQMKKTEEIYFLVYEYRIFYSVELKLYTFLFKKKDNIQNKPEEFTEYYFPIMALQNYVP